MKYFILAFSWGIYFFLHSLLASDYVKHLFRRAMGKGFRFYRLIYSFLSLIGLFAILFLNALTDTEYLFSPAGWIRYVSLVLTAFGVIVIRMAFRQFNLNEFLGFKSDEDHEFKEDGILRFVRHPIYSGTALIMIGFFLFTPTWATALSSLCVFIYLVVGIVLEEKKLIERFGERYKAYKKRVPPLIPNLF